MGKTRVELRAFQAGGVEFCVRTGFAILDVYPGARAEHLRDRTGRVHAKWLVADDVEVVGSANLTRSSQANHEVDAEIQLTPAGQQAAEAAFSELYEAAERRDRMGALEKPGGARRGPVSGAQLPGRGHPHGGPAKETCTYSLSIDL